MHRKGFTLLEILVVLAVIAILATISGFSLIRNIRSAELREAATQVASDLRSARSRSQRQSDDVVLVLPGTAGGTTYRYDTDLRNLPNNTRLLLKGTGGGATSNITYQAPYGELNGAVGSVYLVRSPMAGLRDFEIRIVGVTGKVVLTQAGS